MYIITAPFSVNNCLTCGEVGIVSKTGTVCFDDIGVGGISLLLLFAQFKGKWSGRGAGVKLEWQLIRECYLVTVLPLSMLTSLNPRLPPAQKVLHPAAA